jgi:hypothetical protein
VSGTGLVINGTRELVPGLEVESFHDNPSLRLMGEDVRPRHTGWIRQIVIHTTKGIPGGSDPRPQKILEGFGPSMDAAERCSRSWSMSKSVGGAHLVVDFDGQVSCMADLQTEAAQHASHANQSSLGIEVYQGSAAELYVGQLDVVVALVDWLTARFLVQRQIPAGPYAGPISRLMSGVDDVVGVLGHRDLTNRRGPGDPGSKIFYMLGAAGYEPVSYELGEDRDRWRQRQRLLKVDPVDGIPGRATCAALKAADIIPGLKGPRRAGLWVSRPGDERFAVTVR